MALAAKSIRPFLGARDFQVSRNFYKELGFLETEITPDFSVFKAPGMAFYLQNGYVKDWIDNLQVFVEVADVDAHFLFLSSLDLSSKYPGVRLKPVRKNDWGNECFLHDPSGILWHFGAFTES